MRLSIQEIKNLYPRIKTCNLFQHLSQEKIIETFSEIDSEVNKISKGKLYAQRGELLNNLLILLEGQLNAEILSIEGQVLKVETLVAPTVVAAGLLFADQNFLPVQLTAILPSTILKIQSRDLLALASKDSLLLKKLLAESGNKIHFLAEKLRFMQMSTIEKKLCTYIWEQRDLQCNDLIELPYTIQSLSELFGVSRPALSRALSLLVKQGLVSKEGKFIRITDVLLLNERCLAE